MRERRLLGGGNTNCVDQMYFDWEWLMVSLNQSWIILRNSLTGLLNQNPSLYIYINDEEGSKITLIIFLRNGKVITLVVYTIILRS